MVVVVKMTMVVVVEVTVVMVVVMVSTVYSRWRPQHAWVRELGLCVPWVPPTAWASICG